MTMTKDDKKLIIETVAERFGTDKPVSKTDLFSVVTEKGFTNLNNLWLKQFRVGRGQYNIAMMLGDVTGKNIIPMPKRQPVVTGSVVPKTAEVESPAVPSNELKQKVMDNDLRDIVPEKDPLYVKTTHYKTLETVIKSGIFYPTFITGPSGNGKSLTVIQACANAKKELIRINVTAGTDEDDLVGSFRLVDGETIFQEGPLVEAMHRGATVLIDEIDMLNPNRAAALFTILEGKGVFLKKINRQINPAPGFNIIATANTKGKGSDDGRFMGTNVLNEAFLERFPITVEFDYPTKKKEESILLKNAEKLGIDDKEFMTNLADWASIIRKAFDDGAVDELISTRRLVHIVNAFAIFKDKTMAINLCINRFNDEIKESFYELYTKIDSKMITVDEDGNQISNGNEDEYNSTHSNVQPF